MHGAGPMYFLSTDHTSHMKRLSDVLYTLLLLGLLIPATAVAKPRLGFAIDVATEGFMSTKLQEVKVSSVKSGSPAEKAGLRKGDLIVEMNGKPIKGASGPAMKKVLSSVKAGDHLILKVRRDGKVTVVVDILAAA